MSTYGAEFTNIYLLLKQMIKGSVTDTYIVFTEYVKAVDKVNQKHFGQC
jgi:hypothetical protein